MAKLYFNTALLLSEILIFVNGQTTSYSMSTSISTTSSLSNSATSTSTFSLTITQDLSGVDTSPSSSSSLISNVLVSSSTLTQDLSSTTVAVDPSSRSPSSSVSDSMSVTSSLSVSLSVSTISPSSSQTTVTSATVQLSPTSTSTNPPDPTDPPTTQVPSTGQPSTSLPPGIYVTITLYVKVDACDQTAGVDAQIEANLPNVFRRGNVAFVLGVMATLNSNECRDGAYVKVTIIVRFSVQINFNIENVLRKSLSDNDNKLNNVDTLIIDTNRIEVIYNGLDVKFTIKDGECGRVCCNGGAGGPVNIDVTCTATSSGASCNNIPDTIEEEDHCPNEPFDSCSSVCNQGIYVTIILYVKVDACDQTAGLDAQIEANLPNVFRRGNVAFVLGVMATLNSNECGDGAYVKVTVIVRFSLQINFNIENVLRKSLSDNDNKLNNVDTLIIDTNQIDVIYNGLDVKFTIKDGECGRVCCNGRAGGPVNMDVTCTEKSSGDANCDNIPKTIEEEDHCPNEPYDSCSSVCNQAGFIYSPSLAILILLAVASFLKFGFF